MLHRPAGRDASSGQDVHRYERHRPEQSLLYQFVEQYYPALVDQMAAQGATLPEYVQREFEDYLKCGRLEYGFLRVRCTGCHHDRLVAFSCKRRGFCPSCGARRMAESAALLVDEVLPHEPMRQWVLSVPYPLRFLFASRPAPHGRGAGYRPSCHRHASDQKGRADTQNGTHRRRDLCGGAVKIIACIEDPAVIEKILTYLNKQTASAKPAPWHESRAPPQTVLFDAP